MARFTKRGAIGLGVYPHLIIRDGKGAEAVAFYQQAFAADEIMRDGEDDSGFVRHSRLLINGCVLMLSDDFQKSSPAPTGVTLHLQVDDAVTWFERATAAGAVVRTPLIDMVRGDRFGQLSDPFGYCWSIQQAM
ncbi:MAG: VOC family protein [Caulobacter sp.]|nr:VOC family protein [Caulobacter sp.]